MQIDWGRTINDIFADKLTCPRCGGFDYQLFAGYTRLPEAADYAPRCRDCADKSSCDARKLVVICERCAQELRLRARPVDEEGMMVMLLSDCRRELEDSLDYLTDGWLEDLDVPPEEMEGRLEEYDPEVFAEEDAWRRRLEEEYLQFHRWFREHVKRIPDPGWRSEYVDEIVSLGYTTLLGD